MVNILTCSSQNFHRKMLNSTQVRIILNEEKIQEDKVLIEVTNLTKKYGSHVAVDGLNFKVEKGQIYGFLGPNGAGKSTTMNMITGYLAASSGTITIDGHDILKEPEEAKKHIGYLPEIPPLYTEMTVLEYLCFAADLKKIKKAEKEQLITEAMEMTKIVDVKNRLIRNLSKGYRQRVGLAQAILGYPEVIILDEPTVGLDPKQIIEIRDLIKSLGKKHTVILSSHILSEVSAVCDHILIISKGKLVASDTPENLSKIMSGSNNLSLTVRGKKTVLGNILAGYKEINSFEMHDSVEDNAMDVEIQTEGSTDIREKLFYDFAKEQCPILAMKSSNMTLEDVFLELTSDNASEEVKQGDIADSNDLADAEDIQEVEEEKNESSL